MYAFFPIFAYNRLGQRIVEHRHSPVSSTIISNANHFTAPELISNGSQITQHWQSQAWEDRADTRDQK